MRKYLLLLSLCLIFVSIHAQSVHQPYSFSFYHQLDPDVYNVKTRIHSSLKPYLIEDSLLTAAADSLLHYKSREKGSSWLQRKLYAEHLFQHTELGYSVYADFLPDLLIGKETHSTEKTWLNTRGYQIGGTVGKKFSFYTSGYENQGRFAPYYARYVDQHSVVPGQSYNRGTENAVIPVTKDWSYVTALLSYSPAKAINISLGHDKNFIGDGYRSMLLSDFSSPYTFFRVKATLGNVQYMAMWTGMQDPSAKKLSEATGNRTKGAVFHYLDWNVNDRLSLGFFDAVVWAGTDDEGNRRGFNADYINPVIFLRPLEASSDSPDNAMLGLTAKYEILQHTTVYGQFALDDFVAKEFLSGNGFYRNKYGVQLGLRGTQLLSVKQLNYLVEFNSARPFTYAEKNQSIINYANYNEPLAHPLGANFREFIGMLSYRLGRFGFSGQLNYSKYGYDLDGVNYGKDIFRLYEDGSRYVGNFTGQGLATVLWYGDARVSYLLNPLYNLRIELGAVLRTEKNVQVNNKTSWFTLGLRSSFRNLYTDF
ncbi:gliding motility protein RemB [Pedobacter sp. MC2016-14]|uniref:gliding motility protein RemB n=1 Tax=Pedobacter sp. MC2016-14 TaxID=2897327 RepID=UPI001E2B2B05|nr:gliding motility protein RemB [Pedobacter sp. MC2016-14]MCD0486938.1 gliding motility protein RemB [Pedobacter sp. MC2016-14]